VISYPPPLSSVRDWASSDMSSIHDTASSPKHFGFGTASQEIRAYAPTSVSLNSPEEVSQRFVQEMIGMSAAALKYGGPVFVTDKSVRFQRALLQSAAKHPRR
jgi:hypothetical protein